MPTPQPVSPQARSFNCPQCGAPVNVLAPRHSQSIVCGACGSILDCRTPDVALLEAYEKKITSTPRIPLGRRGKLRGELVECLGYMRRTITVEGTDYTWSEYVLWNPQIGYRWLTEYEGHWSYSKATNAVPKAPKLTPSGIRIYGMSFRHFQTAVARVTFVLGEFPWIVRRGSKAKCYDYVCPPYILSGEEEEDEYNWSLGEYVEPPVVWKAFSLEGAPREPVGVYLNQPSPYASGLARAWGIFSVCGCATAALTVAAPAYSPHATTTPFCCAMSGILVLAAWPIAMASMASSFETRRWSESDHA